jgi:hypothetical protein
MPLMAALILLLLLLEPQCSALGLLPFNSALALLLLLLETQSPALGSMPLKAALPLDLLLFLYMIAEVLPSDTPYIRRAHLDRLLHLQQAAVVLVNL